MFRTIAVLVALLPAAGGISLAQTPDRRMAEPGSPAKVAIDVDHDDKVLGLHRRHAHELEKLRDRVRSRVERGRSTSTDLALVEARLARAKAARATAEAALRKSRARFERIVGQPPGRRSSCALVSPRERVQLRSVVSIGRIVSKRSQVSARRSATTRRRSAGWPAR